MEQQLKTFLSLCKEFIDAMRKIEKDDHYAQTDDLSVLYRFINLDGWKRLEDWRNDGKI